jgi:hypothetical protein
MQIKKKEAEQHPKFLLAKRGEHRFAILLLMPCVHEHTKTVAIPIVGHSVIPVSNILLARHGRELFSRG